MSEGNRRMHENSTNSSEKFTEMARMSEQDKLEIATQTINQMQNLIRPWARPTNLMGTSLQDAFNIGAKFNSENPDLFSAYLKKIEGLG